MQLFPIKKIFKRKQGQNEQERAAPTKARLRPVIDDSMRDGSYERLRSFNQPVDLLSLRPGGAGGPVTGAEPRPTPGAAPECFRAGQWHHFRSSSLSGADTPKTELQKAPLTKRPLPPTPAPKAAEALFAASPSWPYAHEIDREVLQSLQVYASKGQTWALAVLQPNAKRDVSDASTLRIRTPAGIKAMRESNVVGHGAYSEVTYAKQGDQTFANRYTYLSGGPIRSNQRVGQSKALRLTDVDTFATELRVLNEVASPLLPTVFLSEGSFEVVQRVPLYLTDAFVFFQAQPPEKRLFAVLLLRLGKDALERLVKVKRAGYLHRDIKLENVLFSREQMRFELADFGLACKENDRRAGVAGTIGYMAPETLRNRAGISSERSSYPSDIFSLGVTLRDAALIHGDNADVLVGWDAHAAGMNDANLAANLENHIAAYDEWTDRRAKLIGPRDGRLSLWVDMAQRIDRVAGRQTRDFIFDLMALNPASRPSAETALWRAETLLDEAVRTASGDQRGRVPPVSTPGMRKRVMQAAFDTMLRDPLLQEQVQEQDAILRELN